MGRLYLTIVVLAITQVVMSQVPVVLVAGQSNTDGRVDNVELPEYIKRDGYRYCQWSFGSGVHSGEGRFEPFTPRNYSQKPERWAYDAVVYYELERLWQRPFYVIKESLGGTAIDPRCESNSNMHWSADLNYLASTTASDKGGLSLLKAFTENIGACIDSQLSKLPEGYDIKFMLWHQGESDRSQADSYHDNLKAVVNYVRSYLVNKTGQQKYARLPFICGTFSKVSKQGSPKVAAALYQLQQEDPNFHVVDVSDATLGRDQIHFDAAGAELLGKRMYEKVKDVLSVTYSNDRTPIMGWSSWNTYRVNISDTLIVKQADALVRTGLKDAGYNYINIDDGFFGYRDSDGRMHAHPRRFPCGMKPIADYIHSLGLKAGIYSDAGGVTCGSIWDKDRNGIGAGLYGHEEQDARLYFLDWGFDFIKIDYCGAGQELDLDEQERYTAIRQAIDRTGRRDVEINICRWAFPGTWARDLAASWRISGDISDSWSSVKGIIEKNMPLSAYCRNGHFNDMDMLEIGRSLTESEERVHFGLWCMMSSPLLVGCDMTTIPERSLALLKNEELIALNQDPLALQAYPVKAERGTYVLVKDIEQRRAGTRAVALYNPTDERQHIAISLNELELKGKTYVRDLFSHKNLKAVRDSIVADVEPHDVAIFRVEAERRIAPTRYEAEWAYLPLYNDLGKRKKEIHYLQNEHASGGMVVAMGGGRSENSIVWDDVYSADGGHYDLTIHYLPAETRGLEVVASGQNVIVPKLESVGEMATVTLPVTLRQGDNRIELTCPTMWMPDIDKIELRKR